MKFKIPKILWTTQKEKGFDGHCRVTHISKNTFVEYTIQVEAGLFYCYYGGRFKEFNSLDKAKDWAQNTHYILRLCHDLVLQPKDRTNRQG